MVITREITVDVSKRNTFSAIVAKQLDTNSRFLKVTLTDLGEVITVPTTAQVVINALRDDGESKSFLGTANADGTVTVPLTPWMLELDGDVKCDVSVVDSEERKLTSTLFVLAVEEATYSGEEISDDENYDLLVQLLAQVSLTSEEAKAAIADAEKATADAETATKNANAATDSFNASAQRVENAVASIETLNITAAADAQKANAAKTAAEGAALRAEAAEDNMAGQTDEMNAKIGLKGDNLFFNEADGKLYLTSDGEVIGDGVVVATSGGGGGGGASNNAVITLTNTTGWLSKMLAENSACTLSASWSSTEDDVPTGAGVLTVKVGGVVKQTSNVNQGAFTVNVTPYLNTGSNTVKLTVSDVYGNSRTINFTISVVALSLASTFDATVPQTGEIVYTYIPKGSVEKTVIFKVDGEELDPVTVAVSGRQQTYTIPAQTHGSHTLEVYFTAVIDGETVDSNHLYYDLICLESGNTTPIIASAFNRTTATQFENLNIPYLVYDPSNMVTSVVLKANGTTVSEQTVGRVEQTWVYRADDAGNLSLTITCGATTKTITLAVEATSIDVSAETENLELYLSSNGRSNNEADPASWTHGDIACSFAGYNWVTDGWQNDENGVTVHRVSGDARLTIPLQIFAQDFRGTGKTIEIEFATRDVLNYDAVILSCFSGDRGFKLTAQKALLKSAQSEIFTQYKEGEHIRLTLVVEKRAENRLLYIYLNGIMCGAAQYPGDDDFSQATPVNITVGSNDCTIDLYTLRVYNNNLTRHQVLDNWIADTQDVEEKLARYNRNNVYDAYGAIIIDNLPSNLPYIIMEAPALPAYKDNKVNISGQFVDPENEGRCFEFENAQGDVQGTSSAGYPRKNFKLKFTNGFIMGGTTKPTFALNADSVPTSTFTFKTDYASSEGANNVELVKLYNNISPYRIPPQVINPKVRQGIDGFPMVVFHDDGNGAVFVGKYNFNHDKGTPEVFGFAEGDESWEIRNNTSERVLFQSADFSGDDWLNDFEARYPEDNVNHINLSTFIAWVASTDQSKATNAALTPAVTYEGVEYTTDSAEYRLAKFKAEFEDYAVLDSAVFYYLFTELFLMVDSRAKNAFPTIYGTDKFCWLPYDMDTAIGINNEGSLVFGYWLEDTDTVSDDEGAADVYNGQQSVLWINLRQAFGDKIAEMYKKLRSDNVLSYDIVETAFEEHQAKWCEAIWNEDAYFKYLQPLIEEGKAAYLPMLQGSKSEQRKWWLYNRFRYIDSKYNAGDALADFITLRGYAKADITVEPYADIYATIKYGSYLVQTRALRGKTYTLACPLSNVNDTEIYIYSASQIKSIGDLSGLKVGLADFSMATKLSSLKVGDSAAGYTNPNLTSLTVGNNPLLQTLDARNCTKLGTGEQKSIDLSECKNIENVYLDGTVVTGVSLPDGGMVKVLHLPNTITNLTLINQSSITDFVLSNFSNITTLRLENVSANIDALEILGDIAANSRVRLVGVNWSFDTYADASAVYDLLDTMRGLDENGGNVDKAQVSGTIHIPSLTGGQLSALESRYPYLNVTYDYISFIVTYKDYDGTVLHTESVNEGASATDPVSAGKISAPTRTGTDDTHYVYAGWDMLPTSIHEDTTITAQYTESYAVKFYNGATLLSTSWTNKGETAVYTGSTPTKTATAQYTYSFSGWASSDGGVGGYSILNNISAPKSVYAAFVGTLRYYTVRFFNGSTLLQTKENVAYGGSTTYSGTTPTSDVEGEEFSGWSPLPTNITGDTDCYAMFVNPNALDAKTWAEISDYSAAGTAANYFSVGDCKAVTLNGMVGTLDISNQTYYVYILGFDHNETYEGKGIHFGTFKTAKKNGVDFGLVDEKYNSSVTDGSKRFNINHWNYYNYGGWAACDMRYDILGSTDTPPKNYGSARKSGDVGYDASVTTATQPVPDTLMAALPADLRAVMKPMTKYSDNVAGGSGNVETNIKATIDYLPLLSEYEIFGARSYANEHEKNKQAQYAYYAAGNSKKKYKHNATTSSAYWWERSAYYSNGTFFCGVNGNGNAYYYYAYNSYAVAPAFKV